MTKKIQAPQSSGKEFSLAHIIGSYPPLWRYLAHRQAKLFLKGLLSVYWSAVTIFYGWLFAGYAKRQIKVFTARDFLWQFTDYLKLGHPDDFPDAGSNA